MTKPRRCACGADLTDYAPHLSACYECFRSIAHGEVPTKPNDAWRETLNADRAAAQRGELF